MPNVTDTRLDHLASAVEELALAVATARWDRQMTAERKAGLIKYAREQLRERLKDFLIPAVRLIEGGARQDYPEEWTEGQRPKCDVCKRHYICADPHCSQWAKAVAAKLAEKGPEKPTPPTAPEAA